MNTIIIPTKYILKWQFKIIPHFKITTCKKIINCRTLKVIKKTLSGRSVGYNIEGKFYKLSNINEYIELIPKPKNNCPF